MRLAIVNKDKCKSKKCGKECIVKCPVNTTGKICVDIEETKAKISESLCIGCGLCEKFCPFDAISIVNIPKQVISDLSFRYSKNSFCLYRLPVLKTNCILGLIGENGIGKTTIAKILNFELKSDYKIDKMTAQYFKNVKKISVKHQDLSLYKYDDKLSGGERQLKAINETISIEADAYIFDEPSNFLDIKQRLKVAEYINCLKNENKYVLVIDHDLNFMDYCCDFISLIYGKASCYGIVSSSSYNSAEAINHYLNGYLPNENMKFRKQSFIYNRCIEPMEDEILEPSTSDLDYPKLNIEYENFKLETLSGKIPLQCSITIVLGENGSGKTSFIKNLKDKLQISTSVKSQYPKLNLIKVDYPVRKLLEIYAPRTFTDSIFQKDVVNALDINLLYDKNVKYLSGGEQQRLSIILCLAQEKDLYILDEPSALLDIQQRINFTKAIKRFIFYNRKAAIIIEHDISVALSIGKDLHSQMIVFEKEKINDITLSKASEVLNIKDAMNKFLEILDITFRLDQKYKTHRTNKKFSVKDMEQRKNKNFFIDI